jgi:hypothetical protein
MLILLQAISLKDARNIMDKNETLRFKVCVAPAWADFYELLKDLGPYHRSRKLCELARIGFAVQKNLDHGILAAREWRLANQSNPTK